MWNGLSWLKTTDTAVLITHSTWLRLIALSSLHESPSSHVKVKSKAIPVTGRGGYRVVRC
jgi:hypothetical protein